jgi:diguanylate cyclase (GGDEF)-like protein
VVTRKSRKRNSRIDSWDNLPRVDLDPERKVDPEAPSRVSEASGLSRFSRSEEGETTTEALHAPRFDRASLTVLAGPDVGAVFGLSGDTTVIGRGHECQIRLDHASVSRHHARVTREGDTFFLEDLRGRNGTTVGGERIDRVQLRDGDRIGLGPYVYLRFVFISKSEQEGLRRLYESTMLDPLTSAVNRRYFGLRLGGEIAFAKRHNVPLSFLMLDIDRFKQVNDTFGHLAGDEVLQTIATTIRAALRAEDVLARYGGEEFAIVARGLDLGHGMQLADRVRRLVEKTPFHIAGEALPITVSIGVASFDCCGPDARTDDFIRLADERLYRAKRQGRNCCVGA